VPSLVEVAISMCRILTGRECAGTSVVGVARIVLPGAQGVVYDTALRGVHHHVLLRELGLLPVNKVTAAEKGASAPRRKQGRRAEKSVHLEDKQVVQQDGTTSQLRLFARAGAVGLGELTDRGDLHFVELPRVRTHGSGTRTVSTAGTTTTAFRRRAAGP
jgi:hypothetical protein